MAAVEDITSQDKSKAVDKRVLRTVALYADFFAIGLSACVVGPTLVSLEILFGVTTKQIAITFVCGAIGYTTGSLITGLIYDRMNKELLFTMSLLVMAVSMAVSPFTSSLYGFFACHVAVGAACAFGDTGGQSYILYLWHGHKLQGPLMQGVHAMFSIGATFGPFVVKPFLPDLSFLETGGNNNTMGEPNDTIQAVPSVIVKQYILRGNTTVQTWSNLPVGMTTETMTSAMTAQADVEFVRFAYVVIGGLILLPCVMFLVTFCILGPSCHGKRGKTNQEKKDNTVRKENSTFRIKFLIFGFMIFFAYLWVENSPGNYLASFVVKGLGYPNSYGALITSTFWGALGVGRVIAVPLSAFLTARQMLVGDILVSLLGAVLMLFSAQHTSIIWISAAVAGFGMASFFPSAFLWASQYITIDGRASSVFLIASSVGAMSGPYLVGYLFDTLGYMSLAYVMVSACIAVLLLYICAQIFASYHQKHHSPDETKGELVQEGELLNGKAADSQKLQTDCNSPQTSQELRELKVLQTSNTNISTQVA